MGQDSQILVVRFDNKQTVGQINQYINKITKQMDEKIEEETKKTKITENCKTEISTKLVLTSSAQFS